jgi:prevent-host-death family protein
VKVVNMHEAKTTLSQLVEQAERGEEVLLARSGQPVARIVALRRTQPRKLGQWKGRVRMSDDFDAPLPESELASWIGDSD